MFGGSLATFVINRPKRGKKGQTMKKTVFLALIVLGVTFMVFAVHAGESAPKQVKAILFEGGSCEFHSLNKSSSIMKGFEAIDLYLKYSLKQGVETDSLKVLKNDGELVAPDGKRYKAMLDVSGKFNSKDGAEKDTPVYIMVFPVPKSVDAETLKLVYKNQELLLKK